MNPMDTRYVRAEMDYRSGQIRDGIVGRKERARLRSRRPRRLDGVSRLGD
ncbi:MAG TPA: hypothetical protein VGE38_09290 [Nocardioides sp.]